MQSAWIIPFLSRSTQQLKAKLAGTDFLCGHDTTLKGLDRLPAVAAAGRSGLGWGPGISRGAAVLHKIALDLTLRRNSHLFPSLELLPSFVKNKLLNGARW